MLKSGDLQHASTINLTEIPTEVDISKYEQAFIKFSNIIDLIGDTSFLPKKTLQFLGKLMEAKLKVDQAIAAVEERTEDYRRKYIYQMFVKFQPPLCDIIAILLNDKTFNESFPMLRENFKEIWHQMKKY